MHILRPPFWCMTPFCMRHNNNNQQATPWSFRMGIPKATSFKTQLLVGTQKAQATPLRPALFRQLPACFKRVFTALSTSVRLLSLSSTPSTSTSSTTDVGSEDSAADDIAARFAGTSACSVRGGGGNRVKDLSCKAKAGHRSHDGSRYKAQRNTQMLGGISQVVGR